MLRGKALLAQASGCDWFKHLIHLTSLFGLTHAAHLCLLSLLSLQPSFLLAFGSAAELVAKKEAAEVRDVVAQEVTAKQDLEASGGCQWLLPIYNILR